MWAIVVVLLAVVSTSVQATNWYFDHWCGGDLQYLDDRNCVKYFPTTVDREWVCPRPILTDIPEGFAVDTDLSKVHVDTTTLNKFITSADVNACVIVTKRIVDSSATEGFRLVHKYLCAGDWAASVPFETWSSSKIFAMANAGGHLRANETQCESAVFGLSDTVQGKHGTTPLGDLATVVCSYDTTAGYSSNSLSSYFHDIGWRGRLDGLVVDWLGVQGQSLGGNYGEATPSDLKLTVEDKTETSDRFCAADKDPWPVIYSNSITALSAAEMTRRIAQHRELPESMRFPGNTWKDMQTILYGAETSQLFPGLQWGGMTADTAIFTQSASEMQTLLDTKAHNDQWRIFSKLGAGWSSSRLRGEIVTNAYSCVPQFDSDGNLVGGYEFSLTVRGSVPGDSSLKKVESLVMDSVQSVVNYVLETF